MTDDWGGEDFPPLPEWDDASNFEPQPDDFFNDAANFNWPDFDETIFGQEIEDSLERAIENSLNDDLGEVDDIDFLRDMNDSDDDDIDLSIDFLDGRDDIDPWTGAILDNLTDEEWEEQWEEDNAVDIGKMIIANLSGQPESRIRGPFPDEISFSNYLNKFNGWRFLLGIYYDESQDAFYLVISETTE